VGVKSYYFTPGGFLYRKDPGTEEEGDSSAVASPKRSGITGSSGGKDFLYPFSADSGGRAHISGFGLFSLLTPINQ
jgi:hypothetical protein